MKRTPHRISIRTTDRTVRDILKMKGDYRTSVSRHRSLHAVLASGAWTGQRCFIVGGGPSLKGFDFSRLEGERVIAINRAFLDCPFADLMYFMDKSSFYKWVMEGKLGDVTKQAFLNFKGFKVFLYQNKAIPDVKYVPRAGQLGVPISLEDGIFHGSHSGYGALQIALCLQANPIYLLGYDFKHEISEEGHEIASYHEAYPVKAPETATHSFMKGLIELSVDLATTGHPARIVNLNRESALRCFPFGHLEEVLGV